MGLNDKAAEGSWEWVADGSNITYTNWEASNPNDFFSQANPNPQSPHPKPQTPNPEPQTPHLKNETLNPKH